MLMRPQLEHMELLSGGVSTITAPAQGQHNWHLVLVSRQVTMLPEGCMLKVSLQSHLQLHSACLKAPEPGVVSERASVACSALSRQLYQGSHVQWHAEGLLPAGHLQLCIAPHSGLLAFPFKQLDAQHLQLCRCWCCSMLQQVVRCCSSPQQDFKTPEVLTRMLRLQQPGAGAEAGGSVGAASGHWGHWGQTAVQMKH